MQGVGAAVLTAELGSKVAAFVGQDAGSGRPVAVVNIAARRDPAIREEALQALQPYGIGPEIISEVLDGVRS